MLQINRITKRIKGKTILEEISFSLQEGDVLALAGANGAGKSTLLKIIAGLLSAESGCVLFHDGCEYRTLPKTSIAYVSQDIILYEEMRVLDNLRIFGGGLCKDKSEFESKLSFFCERLSIRPFLRQPVSSLSGGQKRRVHIAASLFGNPLLLLLDEPIVGVDAETAKDVEVLVRAFQSQGAICILTSHTPDFLSASCNKLLLLESGKALHLGGFDPALLSCAGLSSPAGDLHE
ncbi:MAG: ABC transporter ATP-binding protein [Peptostreptococcaceae bacterium]|nr:ABC transporter ATP-binding protein [Peptostreptococcaceae bacterium]